MRMLLFASLAALAACAANANPPEPANAAEQSAYEPLASDAALWPARVECDVLATRTPNGVRLEAIASSGASAVGEYDFVITKRDRGGRSDIVQGGEFALAAGDSQSLGSAEVSLERGGGYRARLVLRGAEGVSCEAERSR